MEDPSLDLSVIILSWNTQDLLVACLHALPSAVGSLSHEVLVVDNGSTDGSPERVARDFPQVRLLRNSENRGYALGVNQGLAASRGRTVGLLGSDTEPLPGSLETLVRFLDAHAEAGAVAPRLENFDGSVQRACMRFPTLTTLLHWDTPLGKLWPKSRELVRYQMLDWDHEDTRRVEQPPGTCLIVPRAVLGEVGPMDADLWLFFNDVDWARRMERVRRSRWYVASAVVRHHLGGSTRHYANFGVEWHRNRIRYYRKHFGPLGAFLSKSVLIYAAMRQCYRVARSAVSSSDARRECRSLMLSMLGMLAEGARRPTVRSWR